MKKYNTFQIVILLLEILITFFCCGMFFRAIFVQDIQELIVYGFCILLFKLRDIERTIKEEK